MISKNPLTKVTNKHLLPVGRQPMIYHPIQKLIDAEIDEILIVTGTEHMGDVVNLLGSGKMHFSVMEGWWTDAGTQESYKHANKLVNRQGEDE